MRAFLVFALMSPFLMCAGRDLRAALWNSCRYLKSGMCCLNSAELDLAMIVL